MLGTHRGCGGLCDGGWEWSWECENPVVYHGGGPDAKSVKSSCFQTTVWTVVYLAKRERRG